MISVPKSQKVQSSEGAEPENEDQSEEEDDNDDTSEEEDDTGDDGDHTDARSQESDEKQSKNGPDTTAIASGAAIGTAALLVAILGVTCCLRRRSSQSPKDATPSWVYSAEGHSSMGDSLSRMVIQKPQQVPSVTSGHGSAARRHEQPQPPPSSASGGGSIDQWAREQSLISRSEEIHDDETEFPQSRHRPASYASATEFLGPPRSEWEAPLDSRTEIGMANRSTLAPTALSKFEPRQSMPMGEAAPWR